MYTILHAAYFIFIGVLDNGQYASMCIAYVPNISAHIIKCYSV